MAAEPGPSFRWGVLLRRSKYNRQMGANGEVILFEESTDRQELEVVWHIREYKMGVIVEVYKDIASGWNQAHLAQGSSTPSSTSPRAKSTASRSSTSTA
jgi:hypothetical protein